MTFRGALARAALVLFIALAVAGAAFAFSASQAKVYEGTARLAFSTDLRPDLAVLGSSFAGSQGDNAVELATNVETVGSFDVARGVAESYPGLGLDATGVSDRISVTGQTGAQIVIITARGSTPQAAADLARAYQRTVRRTVRRGENMRAAGTLKVLEERYADLPRTDRRGQAGQTLRTQIGALEVLSQVGSGRLQVIQDARASTDPASPRTLRNVAFGGLFGLLLGVGLVALRDALLRRSSPKQQRAGGSGAGPASG